MRTPEQRAADIVPLLSSYPEHDAESTRIIATTIRDAEREAQRRTLAEVRRVVEGLALHNAFHEGAVGVPSCSYASTIDAGLEVVRRAILAAIDAGVEPTPSVEAPGAPAAPPHRMGAVICEAFRSRFCAACGGIAMPYLKIPGERDHIFGCLDCNTWLDRCCKLDCPHEPKHTPREEWPELPFNEERSRHMRGMTGAEPGGGGR